MKLSEYLKKLQEDKSMVLDDRILYLYDTVSNVYSTKVIHMAYVDQDVAVYIFFDDDVPCIAYDKIRVIRAWTINNVVNCVMGLESLAGNYGESEV